MAFITGKHLSRRTFLRGTGASFALPFLEAMTPAGRIRGDGATGFTRLVCIEESMGAAGSSDWGDSQHLFAPAEVGRGFELATNSQLKPLEAFREYMTIVSNTDCRSAEAFRAEEIGGDHDRSTAVFLTRLTRSRPRARTFFWGRRSISFTRSASGATPRYPRSSFVSRASTAAAAAPTTTTARIRPRCPGHPPTSRSLRFASLGSCSSDCSAPATPRKTGRPGVGPTEA